jgi:hypothetical protein
MAEGDSPIFAANSSLFKEEVLFAAKIGTVPREHFIISYMDEDNLA